MTAVPTALPLKDDGESLVGRRMTVDEFVRYDNTKGLELDDGVVVPKHGRWPEEQMALRESETASRINHFLMQYVLEVEAGRVLDSEAVYKCFAEGFGRRPDVSFVAKGRLSDEEMDSGASPVAPDLAVEVVSPNDEYIKVVRKIRQYLEAGTRAVWLVNAREREMVIYTGDSTIRRLTDTDILDGGKVLPGFSVSVAKLFG